MDGWMDERKEVLLLYSYDKQILVDGWVQARSGQDDAGRMHGVDLRAKSVDRVDSRRKE